MGFVIGLVLGGGATDWLMRKLFHCGWLTSDWFDMQLRQIEGRLATVEERVRRARRCN